MSPKPWLHVGRVARAHGLKGELKLSTFDHEAPSIRVGASVRLELKDGAQKIEKIEIVRHAPDGILVVVGGIRSREAAEAAVGAQLYVDPAELPALKEDEHWAFELVGYAVEDPQGTRLGAVEDVDAGIAHALLQVRTTRGELRELPFVEALVERTDRARRALVVRPIPGLLDDDAEEA